MAVWRLVTHHLDQERLLKWSIDNSVIALGWTLIGDLREFKNPREISLKAHKEYPTNRNWSVSGPQLWKFCHEVAVGDLVILASQGRRACVMDVVGDYTFDANAIDDRYYGHQRKARLTQIDANELWRQSEGMSEGQTRYWSLIKCSVDPRLS